MKNNIKKSIMVFFLGVCCSAYAGDPSEKDEGLEARLARQRDLALIQKRPSSESLVCGGRVSSVSDKLKLKKRMALRRANRKKLAPVAEVPEVVVEAPEE